MNKITNKDINMHGAIFCASMFDMIRHGTWRYSVNFHAKIVFLCYPVGVLLENVFGIAYLHNSGSMISMHMKQVISLYQYMQ
jgi:hypothetical protein